MKNNKFDLLKGTFTAKEATEILIELFKSKIKFHQHDIFGKEERNEGDTEFSKNRIEDLKIAKEEIKKLLKDENIQDKKVRLKGEITIEIES